MDSMTFAPISLSLLDAKGSVVQNWPLTEKKTYRLGRANTNDIILDNTWVSRQHAMLQIEENGTVNAIDMGSANGTMVNGHRIYAPTPLRSGDLIQIGSKSTLTFLQDYCIIPPTNTTDDEEQTVAFMTKTKVTVLICDIRRFTSLSERIGDQKISDIIKTWSKQTDSLVQKYGGRVDKFIGDAVMALWVDNANPSQNVNQALTCALQIAAMTTKLGEKTGDLPWPLTIGAAINTGEAVIGNIGVDGNRDHTVIGDAVNVAFRLEGITSTLGKDLLLGNETASVLNPKLLSTYFVPCEYQVKGKDIPVIAHGCSFDQLRQYLNQQKKTTQ
ncbi:MAG: adenylate/guanylate cyclase domain-containing protein [Desulfobulbaceae bacterium]|nr:adenylate/guanylate cyclase domain-containing protein [Desulfobulbaceae bacterium]